ncbi:MAG: transposase zinc-binding domain-containing protein [Deltaproteobacteria bacterium]|nr:transposase zinc-binding domain-containing protein [Deltaproteobacteria bacterium]
MSDEQHRVLCDIMRCRTAALGGHLDVCPHCGHERPSYNSCLNRHCPKCQWSACERWLDERKDF